MPARRPAASGGRSYLTALRLVLQKVRKHPWRGVSHDADGRRAHVQVTGPTLVSVAFGATYSVAFYREMTAALRSGLRGDRKPLLRLVAEAIGGGTDAGDPVDYSEGLDAAVACHDYPQLYDMRAAPAVRQRQYAAVDRPGDPHQPRHLRAVHDPRVRPLRLAVPRLVHPLAGRARRQPGRSRRPRRAGYPPVPVLVLSGELDSITTPAEGHLVAQQFPNAQQVVVRNSFHVTAMGDTDGCAQSLVRAFVLDPGR